MTKYVKSNSGLVYPEQKPEKPHRDYGLLEIQDEDCRTIANKCFFKLINDCGCTGGKIFSNPKDKKLDELRKKLIITLAKQLLGEDWETEEYC